MHKILTALLALSLVFLFAGCEKEEKSLSDAAKEAAEKAEDAAKDAADEAEEAADDVGDAIEDATN